jgi:hypothetical protein
MRRFMLFASTLVIALLTLTAANPRRAEACTGCVWLENGHTWTCVTGRASGTSSNFYCHTDGETCWLETNDCGGAAIAGDGSVEAAPSYGADALADGEVVVAVSAPSTHMSTQSVALRSPCNDAILSRSVSHEAGRNARALTADLSL